MAGRTPHQAVEAFARPLQHAVSYVTDAVLLASGRDPRSGPHTLTFPPGDPVRLRGGANISLLFAHRYNIVQAPDDPDRGPYKVSTAEYIYELLDAEDKRIIAYHFHPVSELGIVWPRVHLSKTEPVDLRRAHPPTGRVSVEAILRFAILDLGVEPRSGGWEDDFKRSEEAFIRYRTWG